MPNKIQQQEPIYALATATGRSALAIVRLSGQASLNLANKITHKNLTARKASLTNFYDLKGEAFDKGLAIYFQAPASFTGEDVVEFHCHGNPIIVELLLSTLCSYGARLATAGEFSLRAFLNNKIDLAQAEAIADIISSTTEQGLRTATRSLQGVFSERIQKILDALIIIRTNIEAHLDFPDEEIETKQLEEIENKLDKLNVKLTELFQQAQQGERLHTGATIAIAGKPNAGKSSLLNTLAQNEVAIVTEIPGTTRDALSADINIEGIPVHLIDTAGIRSTKDIIEAEGIARAQQALKQADIILWLVDVTQKNQEQNIPNDVDKSKVIYVYNKIDLVNEKTLVGTNTIYISLKTGSGVSELLELIARRLNKYEQSEAPFLARRRHLVALQQAQDSIRQALTQLKLASNLELIAEDLRIAQQYLGEITGEFTSDDLLGVIFSEFCLGK